MAFVRAGLLVAMKLNEASPSIQQARQLLLQVTREEEAREAEALLGWMHLKFHSIRDPTKALELLRSSSSSSPHAGALFLLACCHLRGAGVPTDEEEAAKLLQEALKSWSASSRRRSFSHSLWRLCDIQFTLGQMYLQGCGDVQQDVSRGLKLVEEASEQKHAEATKLLADCYLMGRGCRRDDNKAASLRARAMKEEKEAASDQMSFVQRM